MSDITKKELKKSLMRLLEKESFDKITVKKIVEDCGVNRNTFYYHFRDVFDLLEYLFTSEAEDVLNMSEKTQDWHNGFMQITDYLVGHKKMIYNVYNSISKDQLEQYLYRVAKQRLDVLISKRAEGYNLNRKREEFIVNFYKYSIIGLILDWVKNGMNENPGLLLDGIEMVYEGTIDNLIKQSTN